MKAPMFLRWSFLFFSLVEGGDGGEKERERGEEPTTEQRFSQPLQRKTTHGQKIHVVPCKALSDVA